jgi:hypothetical protein
MIPMFRVWEMGNERATTTECLSDAQPILLRGLRRIEIRLSAAENRQVRPIYDARRAGKVVETVVPGWKETPRSSAPPLRLGTVVLIVPALCANCS